MDETTTCETGQTDENLVEALIEDLEICLQSPECTDNAV